MLVLGTFSSLVSTTFLSEILVFTITSICPFYIFCLILCLLRWLPPQLSWWTLLSQKITFLESFLILFKQVQFLILTVVQIFPEVESGPRLLSGEGTWKGASCSIGTPRLNARSWGDAFNQSAKTCRIFQFHAALRYCLNSSFINLIPFNFCGIILLRSRKLEQSYWLTNIY